MTEDIIDDAKEIFQALEPVEIGTLEDVKPMINLLPPAKGVKLLIREVKPRVNPDNTRRTLSCRFILVDGIPQDDGSFKYKGMGVLTDVCYWADVKKYTNPFFTGSTRPYLNEFKTLLAACGVKFKGVVNDDIVASLSGSIILGNIIQRRGGKMLDKDKQPILDANGNEQYYETRNEATNFKVLGDNLVV